MKGRDDVTIVTRDEVKTCVTCAHAYNDDDYLMCERPEVVTVTPDPVIGGEFKHRPFCTDERRPGGRCGPKGVHWLPRRPDQWPAGMNAVDIAYAQEARRREAQPRPSFLRRLFRFSL